MRLLTMLGTGAVLVACAAPARDRAHGDDDGGGGSADHASSSSAGGAGGSAPNGGGGATTCGGEGVPIEALADQWVWVDVPGAVCADGSPTGIGLHLTTGA